MQTTFKLFILSLLCLSLTLLSGCGGGTPSLTPAEQAEVDKYIKEYGRDALAKYLGYLFEEYNRPVEEYNHNRPDEKLVLKYVRYFVSQGADVNAMANRYGHPIAPLTSVAAVGHLAVVKFLVSKGADAGSKYLSLYAAAERGHLDVVKFLVSKGADVNANSGYSLYAAARGGHLEVVKFLVSKGVNVKANSGGGCPLYAAAIGGHLEVVEFLVSKGVDVNTNSGDPLRDPLRGAAVGRHLEVAKFLVSKGADAGSKNSALSALRGTVFTRRVGEEFNKHEEIIRYLESVGAKAE